MDFKAINASILAAYPRILFSWLSGGNLHGKEYQCADLSGGSGKSFSVNTQSGMWSDFATGERGGDAISLFAAINRLTQAEAAKELAAQFGHLEPVKPKKIDDTQIIIPAPREAQQSDFNHFKNGMPSKVWKYQDENLALVGYVCRFDLKAGKETLPLVFTSKNRWSFKAFPKPRPIYNLPELLKYPEKPVLIVEGEKCADAAKILKNWVAISWAGGGKAIDYTNWQPLKNRKVTIWADRDLKKYQGNHPLAGEIMPHNEQPGMVTANNLAEILSNIANEVRLLDITDISEFASFDGWDIADAVAAGWNAAKITEFAKPRVKIFQKQQIELPQQVAVKQNNVVQMRSNTQFKPKQPVYTPEVPTWNGENEWKKNLRFKEETIIIAKSINNGKVFLKDHPKMRGVFVFNEFNQNIEIAKAPAWKYTENFKLRGIDDTDDTNAKIWLEWQGVNLSISETRAALASAAKETVINPLKEYLNNLQWDSKPRIEKWLIKTFGAEDIKYIRAIGRKFLIGAAARALRPGCQMDTMLILEGLQGKGKSKAVRELFSEKFYTDEIQGVGTKDTAMQMLGRWAIEIAELDVLERSQVNAIKAWITRQTDKFRPPYGRSVIEQPRSSVFVGTVNPGGVGYLKDSTGARRFWPVSCPSVNIEYIKENRDQLWAEAVVEFLKGEKWWLTEEEESYAKTEQRDRYEEDAWQPVIEKFIIMKRTISLNEILIECLEIPKERLDNFKKGRVAKILQVLGWTKHRPTIEGERTYMYEAPKGECAEIQIELLDL